MAKYKNIKTYGLFALIFVVVEGGVPGFQAPDGHNFMAYYLLACAGVFFVPVPNALRVFVLACAASCAWLMFMVANVQPKEMSLGFLKLYLSANSDFQFVLLFMALYTMVKAAGIRMEKWLDFCCVLALVEVFRLSCQRLGWDPFFSPMNQSVTILDGAGGQGNIGWTGMVLAACAIGFCRGRLWFGLIPVGFALVTLKSATPAIAAAGAVATLAFFRFRGTARLCVVLWACFAVILYLLYDPGDSSRFANWARGFDLSYQGRESWVLGYGLGTWIFLFPELGTTFHRAHCEPLQVFFELGFCGVLAMLLYFRWAILRTVRAIGKDGSPWLPHAAGGLAAVTLCALGNFPFHLAGVAAVCVPMMAMFDRETDGTSRKGAKVQRKDLSGLKNRREVKS